MVVISRTNHKQEINLEECSTVAEAWADTGRRPSHRKKRYINNKKEQTECTKL